MTVLAGQKITSARENGLALSGQLLFFASRDNAQPVPTRATEVVGDAISWDNVRIDPYSGWSAANPTRWTLPSSLVPYLTTIRLTGSIGYEASTSGQLREAVWYETGTLVVTGRSKPIPATLLSVSFTVAAVDTPATVGSGDYIELVPLQNTGGALNTSTGSQRSFIAIYGA